MKSHYIIIALLSLFLWAALHTLANYVIYQPAGPAYHIVIERINSSDNSRHDTSKIVERNEYHE